MRGGCRIKSGMTVELLERLALNAIAEGMVALVALVLSYLATIFPALNASRLRPVEGLKAE